MDAKALRIIAVALVGGVLVIVGFDQTEGAIQSDQTALSLRLIYSGIFVVVSIVGLSLSRHYTLTEKIVLRIQADLAERKAANE